MTRTDRPTVVLLNPPGTQRYLRDCYCSSVDKANYYWAPLDLLMQSAHLDADFEISLVDGILQRMTPEQCVATVEAKNPVAVVALCSHLSWQEDRPFLAELKRRVGAPLFVSGDLPRFQDQAVMERCEFIDGVLLDLTTPDIAHRLREGAFPENTSVTHRENGEIVSGSLKGLKWFEHPLPRHDLFWKMGYNFPLGLREPLASVLTMHGCPYKCDYCNTGMIHFARRKFDNMEMELDWLKAQGVRSLKIRDATFNFSRQHVFDFCDLLMRKDYGFKWFCYGRAETLQEDEIEIMSRAGCRFVAFGIESGSPEILLEHKDRNDTDTVINTLRACRRHGIETLGHFVIGLTGENEVTLEQTRQFVRGLPLDFASFNLFDPRPGALLLGEKVTVDQAELTQIPSPTLDGEFAGGGGSYAEGLTVDDLKRWRAALYRTFYLRPGYLWRRLTRIGDLETLRNYLRQGYRVVLTGLRGA
ncbi:MAG: radical SAM protein [Deltaproteobacteria bacterium]|nr:radical SAM protein [Deltaproteobacteria bacterium]